MNFIGPAFWITTGNEAAVCYEPPRLPRPPLLISRNRIHNSGSLSFQIIFTRVSKMLRKDRRAVIASARWMPGRDIFVGFCVAAKQATNDRDPEK